MKRRSLLKRNKIYGVSYKANPYFLFYFFAHNTLLRGTCTDITGRGLYIMGIRNAIYFEYEKISDSIMWFGNKTSLKFNVNLGKKDRSGNKVPFFSEYRYKSNRYKNTNTLITMKRDIRSFLTIEYPNNSPTSSILYNNVYIDSTGILGLRDTVNKFDSVLLDAYAERKGELVIINGKKKYIKSIPFPNNTIEFFTDIYVVTDKIGNQHNEIGVRIILNGEYDFTIPIRTWKSFVYYINTCDFYGWAMGCLNSIFQQMELNNEIVELFNGNDYQQLSDNYDELEAKGVDAKHIPVGRKEKISELFDG